MGYDFLENTHYKRRKANNYLRLPTDRGVRQTLSSTLQEDIFDELTTLPYAQLSDLSKMVLTNQQIHIQKADDLALMIQNGVANDARLFSQLVGDIEDMVPFMGDELLNLVKEPLLGYYQNILDIWRTMAQPPYNEPVPYHNNIIMLYFLHRVGSTELVRLFEENANNHKKDYLTQEEMKPIAGKGGVIDFLRLGSMTYTDVLNNILTIPYDIWKTDVHKLNRLKDYIKNDSPYNVNYLLRNNFVELSNLMVTLKLIRSYHIVNPELVAPHIKLIDRKLKDLIKKVRKALSTGNNKDEQLKRRRNLVYFMMFLSIHGFGDYHDEIQKLKYE